ncbi:WD40 repeat-like protein [Panaeolus papilionaceus]|nr:WD40 repeat-like protein [Panaeolus papilionaceus]
MIKLAQSDRDSPLSTSPDMSALAGPSSGNGIVPSKGYTNGFSSSSNGTSGGVDQISNGVRHGKSIARVNPPGTTLYDDSVVDREEFVRLVVQSLRDVGYVESAVTLEAESGYTLESQEVSQFRQHVLEGQWSKAEAALMRLGVSEEEGLSEAKFLISRQKYLELLEAKKPTSALQVLRNELAPLNVEPDHLHTLSSLIMCSEPEDLLKRANWDGASGSSRQRLLEALHNYIPSAVMIPQRRFAALLDQSRVYQRNQCLYHNTPIEADHFSLYSDHHCNSYDFPSVTTTILDEHKDEVWNIEWSHDGAYLASASRDRSAIIWHRGKSLADPSSAGEWSVVHQLKEHPYPVGCLAWSLDDKILLTCSDNIIKLWNTKNGQLMDTLDRHSETVTAISWLPDGSGFISGGLDRKIIIWNTDGQVRDSWGTTTIRLTDLAVTPDYTHIVAVGMESDIPPRAQNGDASSVATNGTPPNPSRTHKIIVYDVSTKDTKSLTRLDGELTSVQISQDSQYALINHSPNEVHLWDIHSGRVARKYSGQSQGRHVIRSCFGGVDGNFVVSGSEDGNVYVWHRETTTLLEILSGHGEGSVNSVAWNPVNERMFASCSDDRTIRIWETPPPPLPIDMPLIRPAAPPTTLGVEKGKGKPRQQLDVSSQSSSSKDTPQA